MISNLLPLYFAFSFYVLFFRFNAKCKKDEQTVILAGITDQLPHPSVTSPTTLLPAFPQRLKLITSLPSCSFFMPQNTAGMAKPRKRKVQGLPDDKTMKPPPQAKKQRLLAPSPPAVMSRIALPASSLPHSLPTLWQTMTPTVSTPRTTIYTERHI